MKMELAKESEDEISLIDLFSVLWHRRKMIIRITLAAMAGVVIFSIISLILPVDISPLPNEYTPQALLLINNSSSSGGGLSSLLNNSSGLSSLASLAGINVSGSAGTTDLAIYLVSANSLLDAVVDKFDLITRYKIKIEKSPRAESRKALKKLLLAEIDEKSGVLVVSFTDTDPEFARDVVNFCVLYLEERFSDMGLDKNKLEEKNIRQSIENTFAEIQALERKSQELGKSITIGAGAHTSITLEINRLEMELDAQRQIYIQLKVQHEILKVTLASEKPVFQILEMAEIPDQKSGPSRGLLCIIVTFAAGFLAVFLAFTFNAIDNIKNDPEAMAKIRRTNHAG
jgi:uncharacterized protein involved in exopolysaccharide biosynthesis